MPVLGKVVTVTANGLEDAIRHLYVYSWPSPGRRHRPPYVYRGLDQTAYRLETTLQRLERNKPGSIPKLEYHLIRSFQKYARRDVVARDSHWHWLTVAQHHGLATRLLDWTYSPMVALHFATANMEHFDKDGVVWMVDMNAIHTHLPKTLAAALDGHTFTTENLASVVSSFTQFDRLGKRTAADGCMLFFEPPSIDDRIVNQFALHSVLSSPLVTPEDWLTCRSWRRLPLKHPVLRRVVIPAARKWEIRDKLDRSNINDRVLFPGLDGLSRWLNREFFHRGDRAQA